MKKLTAITLSIFVILFILVSIVLADATYVVQPGDSLSTIARRFSTTVAAIVAANDIQDPNVVVAGRELVIPDVQETTADQPQTEATAVSPPPVDSPPPADSPAPVESAAGSTAPGAYTVVSGDSLIKIAANFGTDYLTLAALNDIVAPYHINVGQTLKVPGAPGTSPPAQTAGEPAPVDASASPAPAPESSAPEAGGAFTVSAPKSSASAPRVRETTISIPTYGYQNGFIATDEGDSVYPYPRLDFSKVSDPVAQSYKALILENGYISVTVLPELGGRVYSLKDKATGRELLYQNPVIKPTSWGYREWWLAAGGIEWAFPVSEHGLNEWRPWSYSTTGNSITVSDVDDRTGMEVGATLSLDADHSTLTIQPWARNLTPSAQSYQLWLNGMLAPGGNRVSGNTQFIVPAGQVTVHSTGDDALPGEGSVLSWPVHDNRDLSFYGNWDGWLGFFAPTNAGFSGVFDHDNGQGLVRAHAPGWPGGLKMFGPSTLPSYLWTDDDSNYVEMWSGATADFNQYTTLEAGQRVDWTEHWYPINGTNGFNFANKTAALRLESTGSGADVALAVSTPITGDLILYAANEEAARWPVNIGPGQAFNASWSAGADQGGSLGLRLLSGGQTVAQTGQMP